MLAVQHVKALKKKVINRIFLSTQNGMLNAITLQISGCPNVRACGHAQAGYSAPAALYLLRTQSASCAFLQYMADCSMLFLFT